MPFISPGNFYPIFFLRFEFCLPYITPSRCNILLFFRLSYLIGGFFVCFDNSFKFTNPPAQSNMQLMLRYLSFHIYVFLFKFKLWCFYSVIFVTDCILSNFWYRVSNTLCVVLCNKLCHFCFCVLRLFLIWIKFLFFPIPPSNLYGMLTM